MSVDLAQYEIFPDEVAISGLQGGIKYLLPIMPEMIPREMVNLNDT